MSGADLTWVQKIVTVDAIDQDTVEATTNNGDWRLIAVGQGAHGQTTLTFGWPYPDGDQ